MSYQPLKILPFRKVYSRDVIYKLLDNVANFKEPSLSVTPGN